MDSVKNSVLDSGITERPNPGVSSAVDSEMDSEATLQRLKNALGLTLRWTRDSYDSENATFLDEINVEAKKNNSFLDEFV